MRPITHYDNQNGFTYRKDRSGQESWSRIFRHYGLVTILLLEGTDSVVWMLTEYTLGDFYNHELPKGAVLAGEVVADVDTAIKLTRAAYKYVPTKEELEA